VRFVVNPEEKRPDDRAQVAALAEQIQQVTGRSVELAYVDQVYTGKNAAEAAQAHGIRLEVVRHPMAKRGFVLLPRRWVLERSFAWAARFRRLARDYETPRHHPQRPPLARLRLPHAPQPRQHSHMNFNNRLYEYCRYQFLRPRAASGRSAEGFHSLYRPNQLLLRPTLFGSALPVTNP
jgi:transposase